MAVYVIGQICIKNMEKWLEYKNKVKNTLEPYGAKILLRGTKTESFVGTTKYPEVVAIEFETLEKAKQWYNSNEYQSIVSIRQKGADITLHVYE
ncbi:MAG: DUF1330 domain-containing protein [Halarcobacter sp.]